MKHLLMAAAIAAGAYYFGFHESALDRLLIPPASASAEKPGMTIVETVNQPFSPADHLVPGAVTILYFYSDSCPGCRTMDSNLGELLRVRPDVAVRKFHLGSTWSVGSAYEMFQLNIGLTPFTHIYDSTGKLVAADEMQDRDANNLLYKWMNAELKRDYDARQAH